MENVNNINSDDIRYKKINNNNKKSGFYCSGCNKYYKVIRHQKNRSENILNNNGKYSNLINDDLEINNHTFNDDIQSHSHKRYINNTYENSNDINKNKCSCSCPGCEFSD